MEITSSRWRTGAHGFYQRLGYQDACPRSARFLKSSSRPVTAASQSHAAGQFGVPAADRHQRDVGRQRRPAARTCLGRARRWCAPRGSARPARSARRAGRGRSPRPPRRRGPGTTVVAGGQPQQRGDRVRPLAAGTRRSNAGGPPCSTRSPATRRRRRAPAPPGRRRCARAEVAQHHRPAADVQRGLGGDGAVGGEQRRRGQLVGELRVASVAHLLVRLPAQPLGVSRSSARRPVCAQIARAGSSASTALPKQWSKWWWVLTRVSGCRVTARTAAASSAAWAVGGEGVHQQRRPVADDEGDVDVEHRLAQHVHPVGDLGERGQVIDAPAGARSTNRCRSTSTRSTRPRRPPSSPSVTSRPRTAAAGRRPWPAGPRRRPCGRPAVAARWSSSTRVPTVVDPARQPARGRGDRGRLGQRQHPRRAQHRHVAGADRLRGVGVGDGEFDPRQQPRL